MTHHEAGWIVCNDCGERARIVTADPKLGMDLLRRFELKHMKCGTKRRPN